MNNLVKKVLYLTTLFFILSIQTPTFASTNNHISIESVAKAISTIQKYHVKLTTKIYPPSASDVNPNLPDDFDPNRFMEITTEVFGESGKKMKIITHMELAETGTETENELIFDGTWLWVQQKVIKAPKMEVKSPMISAVKIHIPSVSPNPEKEPFNTIYGASGTGLYRYKDLPGTLFKLIQDYDLKNVTNSKNTLFAGTKKPNQQGTGEKVAIKKLHELIDRSTNYCKIWVSKDTQLIDAYSVGKSEEIPAMHTRIEYISVNKELPDNIFTYVPPENVVVKDVTSAILEKAERL